MFRIVEKNQKLVKGIMIVVTATFVLWGVGGYLGMSGDDGYVAEVGSTKIYTQDIDNAMSNNPQNTDKMQVLFGLINRQLLLSSIQDNHMTATKQQLQQAIAAIPIFQESGTFSLAKYEEFLKSRMQSTAQFQSEIQKQILLNDFINFFQDSYFSSTLFQQKFAALLSKERNVSSYVINPTQFFPLVSVTESDIQTFYQQNIAKFTTPEQVKVEYLTLSSDYVAQNIHPSPAEIDKYITDHKNQAPGAQVDVSHILFIVPQTATPEERAKIKKQAEEILANVRANPREFGTYARKYSQDPGSAAKGGDLGFFGKGIMAKPFENEAFKMKVGQISPLVETSYGYHILKLNATKGTDDVSIRAFATTQLQKQRSTSELQKMVEELNDITYNQATSLAPAAKKLNLTIQTSPWIDKGATSGEFALPKVQSAIFGSDVIKNHNNSEVIDLGGGSYAVYHVVAHNDSKVQPMAEVTPQITEQIKLQKASHIAYSKGQDDIKQLNDNKLSLTFTNPQTVNLLSQNNSITPNIVKQIFSVSSTKFPAYTGGINAQGEFVIYKISSETEDKSLEQQSKALLDQIDTNMEQLETGLYLNYLKTQYKVTYKVDRLNLQTQ